MNTTTNTRGVSEAMRDAVAKAVADVIGHGMREKCYAHADAAIAALSAEPAAQPEDSRCPPTYRREEAVKALIGKGWTWDGKAWAEPAAQGEAVAWRWRDNVRPGLPWYLTDSADYAKQLRQSDMYVVEDLYTAPPAQPAERVPEGWVLVPREPTAAMLDAALKLQGDDAFLARAPAVLSAFVKVYRAMLATTPAPSEGGWKAACEAQRDAAIRAHGICYETMLAHPDVDELGDDGLLHDAIHDILRVETPAAAPAAPAEEGDGKEGVR